MNEPTRLLIAAMGGEGGGVLAGWIVEAARAAGLWGQRTSIPGVAQRTGATTYYIEVMPTAGTRRPVLALNPTPGQVDVVLSTELLETARAVQSGLITPDRTFLIASSHRVYTVAEKSAMGDGRIDSSRLEELARRSARRAVLVDFAQVAADAGSHLNAVMLGALSASRVLPISADDFRAAIRSGGKAEPDNLRGFEAGVAAVGGAAPSKADPPLRVTGPAREEGGELENAARRLLGPAAGDVAVEGVRRLLDYQDAAYARLYLERLSRFSEREGAGPEFMRELARHLAVRMSFEDTIRVAQLKLRGSRIKQVDAEARAKAGDVVHITEFLKPGPDEILTILPPALARPLLGLCARRGWSRVAVPMRVRTTSVSGFARLKLLALLRPLRPHSLRFAEEQAWIETWLDLVEESLRVDARAAAEVVETARLVKGYGDSDRRGRANWRKLADRIIRPMLANELAAGHFADAVMQARIAALADPDGRRLDQVLEAVWSACRRATGIAAE
ncbi:MAG TPA: indolepyruvate oxidoreductase subunit beta family protein [Microvirga sp.]|nr:indolepyruvate oxidoreductase subunit beta family protein [Microvirga sp.]